jgi:rfaE bifunctional protein nucleotidyltransferase chain/domain
LNAIELANVSKIYRKYSGRQFATLKSALLQRSILSELAPSETFAALQDVSFAVAAGRTCGVIGRNGSGKSTALKLVAGITKPTSGTVVVNGRISALIELGAGFHPEISGRENVFINGIMLGLSRREIERRFDEIVEFAELREFIEAPVKTYSSGMYLRLGFAVAIHVDPDVLLVDEVLAVGDEGFTHKCLDKFAEFRRLGKTILLVTHSLGLVERFCDDALWLDGGRVRSQGDPKRVVDAYLAAVEKSEDALLAVTTARAVAAVAPAAPVTAAPDQSELQNMFQAVEGRWGSRQIEITAVTLLGPGNEPSFIFHTGEPMRVKMTVVAHAPATDFVFGVSLFNADGVCCYGTNTYIEQMDPQRLEGEVEVTFAVERLDLVEGTYKLDVAVHTCDGYPYDYHRLLYTFRVKSRTPDVGIYRPEHHWSFSGGVTFKRAEVTRTQGKGSAPGTPSRAVAAAFAEGLRRARKRVVFTNGVFDLLHPGHVRYLKQARALGDALIVGVNSDRSVRSNKGEGRPITPEHERAEILAALDCVDAVAIFDEDTPHDIIAAVQPDILVKGADWGENAIVGRDIVEARGGRVVRIAVEPGYSTTAIVEKIRLRIG